MNATTTKINSILFELTIKNYFNLKQGRAGEFHGINYCGGGAGYILSQKLLNNWAPHIPECQRLRVGKFTQNLSCNFV